MNRSASSSSLRSSLFGFLTCLVGCAAATPAADALKSPTCHIAQPPATAGFDVLMGTPMRVHPAPEAITSTFTGCQSLWAVDGGKLELQMRIAFVGGMPRQLIGTEAGKHLEVDLSCTRVKPSGARAFDCEPLGAMPLRSLAKECLKQRAAPADSQGYVIASSCVSGSDDQP